VLGKLRTLKKDLLDQAVGKYLSARQLDALEVRRVLLVRHFDREIRRKGQSDVLYDLAPRR
jgi:hypothetical protein